MVAIRKNLTGENLAVAKVEPEDIVVQNFSWITFDFHDILVTPGDTYYIVSYTDNVSENWYLWGANNDSSSYLYGCAWVSVDDGGNWTNQSMVSSSRNEIWNLIGVGQHDTLSDNNESTWDMCFKTFGRDMPELQIDIKGGIGITLLIKNNGSGNAMGIEFNMSIHGGLLGLINKQVGGIILNLPAGEEFSIKTVVFGVGLVEIALTVESYMTYTLNMRGLIILFWVWVLLIPS
ncbi:MAG: hypothetical protein DRN08_00060 [Thermoplasmata archaeon]|nr:MAG: hypothetical protein DRN08_00060 [Thermoplasmata archaeon]